MQHHVGVSLPGPLHLGHPELGEMPPCPGFLGSEGGTDRVDVLQSEHHRFRIELPALGEIDLVLDVEVRNLEQR